MVCGCRRLRRRMVYEEMLFKILHLGVLTFFSFAKDFSHLFFVKKVFLLQHVVYQHLNRKNGQIEETPPPQSKDL